MRSMTTGAPEARGCSLLDPSSQATRVATSPRPSRTSSRPPCHSPGRRPSAILSTACGSGWSASSRATSSCSARRSCSCASRRATACAALARRCARPAPHRSATAFATSATGPRRAKRRSCGPSTMASARAIGTGTSAPSQGIRARCGSSGAVGLSTSTGPSGRTGAAGGLTASRPSPDGCSGRPAPPPRRTRNVDDPRTMIDDPSTAVGPRMARPLTTTPLVEATSSTTIPDEPMSTLAWCRLSASSATTRPAGTERPMCRLGGVRGQERPESGPPTTARSSTVAGKAGGSAAGARRPTATDAPWTSGGIPTCVLTSTVLPPAVRNGTGSSRWSASAAARSAAVCVPDHRTRRSTGRGLRRGTCTVMVISMAARYESPPTLPVSYPQRALSRCEMRAPPVR